MLINTIFFPVSNMSLTMDGNSMPKFLIRVMIQDAKVGQFFLKNEHAAGISASAATGFLNREGRGYPLLNLKDKAFGKIKRIS